MRTFDTGATRGDDEDKLDFEGFLSPLAIERYARYLHEHRRQADGHMRASDNWAKGIPFSAYMKSGWRHFHKWWKLHREGRGDYPAYAVDWGSPLPRRVPDKELEDAICGVIFNAQGYLHELLKIKTDD